MEFSPIDLSKDFTNGVIGEARRFRERSAPKSLSSEGDPGPQIICLLPPHECLGALVCFYPLKFRQNREAVVGDPAQPKHLLPRVLPMLCPTPHQLALQILLPQLSAYTEVYHPG